MNFRRRRSCWDRKVCTSNLVLLTLKGQLKRAIDKNNSWSSNDGSIETIILHLSRLVGKLHAYGYSEETLVLFYSYLKRRKQNVKTNSTYSKIDILFPGVPYKSIVGPILFLTSFLVTFSVD